jgi:cholest-4-en-3-one 26-monooxygenase
VVTPEHYERNGYPHAEWTWLRRHAPVFWYERSNVDPFWAITKYADIVELGKQPDLFLNAPRLAVFTNDLPPPPEGQSRHLLNMDPPDHARYRRVTSHWFTPRAIRAMDDKVARVTREVLDAAAEKTTGDFVQDVSAKITIAVIAEMLGVPRRDWQLLFRWTNEIIAPQDPEFQRGTPQETLEAARLELFTYFHELAERRRREPSDDIVSLVANGQVNGAPLPAVELLSYYFLLVVAGNETTRNAMTGGMLAFLETPSSGRGPP